MAGGLEATAVLVADLPQPGPVAEEHPGGRVGVGAQQMRAVRVVAAEVEEAQRPALDRVALRGRPEVADGQVPPGDVDRGVDQDVVVEVARHEGNPALVDELAALRIDDAVAGKPPGPPVEKGRRARADSDEAEVEDARVEQDALDVGEPAIERQWVLEVRRQHDVVGRGELGDVVQRGEDLDVRVEVGHRVRAVRQQRPQQEGLYRGGQLHHRVRGGHPAELLGAEARRLGADRGDPGVHPVRKPAIGVDHQGCEGSSRVVLQKALREDRGLPQVVAGDDRAGVHDGGRLAALRATTVRRARARSSTCRSCPRRPPARRPSVVYCK